jgi:hypothetical protein
MKAHRHRHRPHRVTGQRRRAVRARIWYRQQREIAQSPLFGLPTITTYVDGSGKTMYQHVWDFQPRNKDAWLHTCNQALNFDIDTPATSSPTVANDESEIDAPG